MYILYVFKPTFELHFIIGIFLNIHFKFHSNMFLVISSAQVVFGLAIGLVQADKPLP